MPNIVKFPPDLLPDQFFVDIARHAKSSKWSVEGVILEDHHWSEETPRVPVCEYWLGARMKFLDGLSLSFVHVMVVSKVARDHNLTGVYSSVFNPRNVALDIKVMKLDSFTKLVFEQECINYPGRMVKMPPKRVRIRNKIKVA